MMRMNIADKHTAKINRKTRYAKQCKFVQLAEKTYFCSPFQMLEINKSYNYGNIIFYPAL